MNEQLLIDKSIETVRDACRKYWLEKNSAIFLQKSITVDIPLVGVSEPDWTENFTVVSENYQCLVQTEDLCMVVARGSLKDAKKIDAQEIIVDVSALCKVEGEDIKFVSVHMNNPKRAALTYNPDMLNDSHYRNLLDHMYDLVIEYKMSDNVLTYSKTKYRELMHSEASFVSIDQWFWHMCSNHVVEQDLEKMDMFRGNDIRKRLKNKDYVFDTEVRVKRDPGEIIWLKMKFAFVPSDDGESVASVFVMVNDITDDVAEKMQNEVYARVDDLTKIWNRRYTEELINEKISKVGTGTFVIFDVDHFKNVNDTYGHITGDELLRKIADKVSKYITSDEDVFGRLGGDEFIIYYSDVNMLANEKRLANMLEEIKFTYCENNVCTDIHFSAGIALASNSSVRFEELYHNADKALYEAKKAGRNTYRIYG